MGERAVMHLHYLLDDVTAFRPHNTSSVDHCPRITSLYIDQSWPLNKSSTALSTLGEIVWDHNVDQFE